MIFLKNRYSDAEHLQRRSGRCRVWLADTGKWPERADLCALKPDEAMEYVTRFPKIESVLFGASSKAHIQQTKDLIEQGFARHNK